MARMCGSQMKQNSIKDHVRKILHVKSCEPEIKRFISKFAWLPTHPIFLHARNFQWAQLTTMRELIQFLIQLQFY